MNRSSTWSIRTIRLRRQTTWMLTTDTDNNSTSGITDPTSVQEDIQLQTAQQREPKILCAQASDSYHHLHKWQGYSDEPTEKTWSSGKISFLSANTMIHLYHPQITITFHSINHHTYQQIQYACIEKITKYNRRIVGTTIVDTRSRWHINKMT